MLVCSECAKCCTRDEAEELDRVNLIITHNGALFKAYLRNFILGYVNINWSDDIQIISIAFFGYWANKKMFIMRGLARIKCKIGVLYRKYFPILCIY